MKMKFQGKTKKILICICILCLITIPLVFLGVLPFIIFPITLVITVVIEFYILFKWLKWKNGLAK
jgi:hypothetical protein